MVRSWRRLPRLSFSKTRRTSVPGSSSARFLPDTRAELASARFRGHGDFEDMAFQADANLQKRFHDDQRSHQDYRPSRLPDRSVQGAHDLQSVVRDEGYR